MTEGTFDLRYASREEHFALRERVAVLETEIKPALARIENKLNAPPPVDHLALAMQRGFDQMTAQPSRGDLPYRLIALAVIAVVAAVITKGHLW